MFADDDSVFAENGVDEGRFADIGAAGDSDAVGAVDFLFLSFVFDKF